MKTWNRQVLWLAALIGLLLAACSPVKEPAATPSLPAPTAVSQVETKAAPTEVPSPTPQPGKTLLIAPSAGDVAALQPVVEELSRQSGMAFETRGELQPADLTQDIRVVILAAAPANLAELLAAAPQARFLVYSAVDLPGAANLSVIRKHLEYQAFVAGYVSVLLSTDWRSAGLLPADGPLGGQLQDAFVNGGRYFCGVCASGWPLGIYYPQVVSLPAVSDGTAWQAAAAGLFDNQKVEVFYLSSESVRQEVINDLQGKVQFDKTVLLLGDQKPPEALLPQWAVTVTFDLAAPLQEAWPGIVNGSESTTLAAPLILADVNANLLGEGRLRLVKELMAEIVAGRILPFTVAPQ